MFDVAWTEYLLIVVVALVLLGPKELPVVLRILGRWVAKARQITSNLEHQLYNVEDNSQSPTFEQSKNAERGLFTYQRVFSKQHLPLAETLIPAIKLMPKPWL